MDQLKDIPAWLGGAAIGAVIAALTYAGKSILAVRADRLNAKRERKARLLELQTLLRTGRSVFLKQHQLVKRLLKEVSWEVDLSKEETWEGAISAAHVEFSPEQKATHLMIRAMSEHAMTSVNRETLDWLRRDVELKTNSVRSLQDTRLAELLDDLDTHLTLWMAKRSYWLDIDPKHCLVYLADEAEHGPPFPRDLDGEVAAALRKM